ncbi:MAG: UTP--glucose-1-phosphate uridylyltransferase [Bacilli bacterium]|nr:UTP--glucose-1-phosphate uridylyltransferase [Bacilli bacterium]MDD3422155.1 UTP--glucose-1-phosphate uridylyltransferase [Bacilli bacterium]MDD4065457.1 UTP--glucose-1-phosphate uridylyltransferase [Bacilli bacterium]
MKIKKAVIPAAGYGTRFLPITKAVSKEMLPIIDVPTIELIIDEAVRAGIKEIIIVISKHKQDIVEYFTRNAKMENFVKEHGKEQLVAVLRHSQKLAKITFVYQKTQKGLGDAILAAEKAVGNEPFAVLLGDDVVMGGVPAIKQLIDCYNEYHTSVVGVQKVPLKVINKYGAIKYSKHKGATYFVEDFIEKPDPSVAPSRVASLGRYVLTPEIFAAIKQTEPGVGGEIQLTDAIKSLITTQGVCAYEFSGTRYDVGTQLGFVELTIDQALKRADIGQDIKKKLKKKVEE